MRLLDSIDNHARHLARKPAVVDAVGSATYAELDDATAAVAAHLLGAGVRPGDVVALAVEPNAPAVALLLGVMRAGAVAAPLNTRLAPAEIDDYLARIAPTRVLVDPAAGVDIEGAVLLTGLDQPGTLRERLDVPAAPGFRTPLVAEEHGSIALPTGGTTGSPKAALWSRRGLSDISISNALQLGVTRSDRELYISPMFHITLVAGLLPTLYTGATVRLGGRFEAAVAARLFDEFAPTRMFSTPLAFTRLLEQLPEGADYRDRRFTLTYGASRNAPGFRASVLQQIPATRLITGYGATEHGPATRLYTDDPEAEQEAAVGHPVAGVRIDVVDAAGNPLPDGEVGEFVVHAPWQVLGYLGTTETPFAPSGGVRSGDLGYIGPEGGFFLAGRTKEVIKTGGENVYPNEVETVIQRHPMVADAGVYGVPDDTWGERVEAAVALAPAVDPADIDAEALRAYCSERLAGYKVPKVIRFVDVIPYTPNLKLDRRQLRADAVARHG